MPHHLMNLRHVPDDEADEIRALFEENNVSYYETPPSRWGISMGGFWVHDEQEAERAKALLEDYQLKRVQEQRALYQQDLAEGRTGGLWFRLRQKPVTPLAASAAIIGIALISLLPFLRL